MLSLILAGLIVALGQPGWIPWLGPVAAICGYALFWQTHSSFRTATLWYALVQAVQLSWMTAIDFQGWYIIGVYIAVCLFLGLQFAILSLLVRKELSILRLLAIASLWTLFEWVRQYILCGFTFNPAGLALASYVPSMQLAAVWGILGLSFWVMLVNLSVHARRWKMALMLGAFPYIFGLAHLAYHKNDNGLFFQALLIQPHLLPSEKAPLLGHFQAFIPPLEQWRRILTFIEEQPQKKWDLIALPEAALPFSCEHKVYPAENVENLFKEKWGESPTLSGSKVSNAFFAQAIANHYHSEVIAGFDGREQHLHYAAAYHFSPNCTETQRYDKQVLLPLAEYLPFDWLTPLVYHYGITDFFTHGTESKVFFHKVPLAVSICYEETFPDIIREGRLKGAELLVNVTNDNWYPNSRLPEQHFSLGRLRAVENGVPCLRACNSGVTASVDSLGRVVSRLDNVAGALSTKINIHHHATPFSFWGNGGIIGLSLIIFCTFLRLKS